MTLKREKLVRSLAALASEHGPDDWLYAASQLDALAELSRVIAAQTKRTPSAKQRKPKPPSKLKAKQINLSYSRSKEAQKLSRYLDARERTASIGTLRELSSILGIKSELPRTSPAILEVIYRHIDGLENPSRSKRVDEALRMLEAKTSNQSDQYDRWVSLITKKPPNS